MADSSPPPELIHGLIDVPQKEVVLLLEAGYLYLEMGKHKEAEEVFTGVAALVPHSEVPHIALGNLEFAQGRFQRALKAHQEALKKNPQSAIAQAHVGEALLFLKRADEAKKALDQAIAMDPTASSAAFARALLDAHAEGALARS